MKHFVERLNPEAENYIVRWWEGDLGAIDPVSGEPWRGYDYLCVLSVVGAVAEVKGARSAPGMQTKAALCALGAEMGIEEFWFELWRNGRKRRVTIRIPAETCAALC